MENFKKRWEIQKNWQLIYPLLGVLACAYTCFKLSNFIVKLIGITNPNYASILISIFTVIGTSLLTKSIVRLFEKLKNRWKVTYRWEYIAIFLVFSVTGSTATLLSKPILELVGVSKETSPAWVFWPIRILLIFPTYQIALVVVGWLFGQFDFFWKFEKKMLKRLGLGKFLKE